MTTDQGELDEAVESEGVQAVSGLDYQAFWATESSAGWLDAALGQAADWVRERLELDVDLSQDGDAANSDRSKRVQVLHRQAGREHGVRLRAWNTNNGTTFIVTVLAVDGPGGGWLLVQASSSDRTRRTAKPAVADRILAVVDFTDIGPLRSTVQHISEGRLDDLEELINHPDRRFPVIVAAPVEGVDFGRWIQAVTQWTRHSAGIAHVVSLDPVSAEEFTRRHGRRAVQSATLRTYPPGADLNDAAVEMSARWLTPRSLAGSDTKIARIVEAFVREYQVKNPVPLPPAVREWSRAFDRFSAQQLRSAVSPTPATLQSRIAARHAAHNLRRIGATREAEQEKAIDILPSATGDMDLPARFEALEAMVDSLLEKLKNSEKSRAKAETKLSNVQDFLALPDLEEESLLELLDVATQTPPDSDAIAQLLNDNDDLLAKVNELEDERLNEMVNLSDLNLELNRLDVYYEALTREASFLRSKVAEHDQATAYNWVDDGGPSNPLGECPSSWDDLVEDARLSEQGLVFTGNKRIVKGMKSLDLDGRGLRAAWDALGTLASYRAARQAGIWDSSVHAFCETAPSGAFHVPPNKHAKDETSATRKDNRLAECRLLPVPKTVDPTGHVYMWAHFKPHSWSAHQKLRIHYYDQFNADEKLYIGHIGHHLPSGSTDKVHR